MPNIVASGPTVPGQEGVEHQTNEFIVTDQLVNITKICAHAIYDLAKYVFKEIYTYGSLEQLLGFSKCVEETLELSIY
jgi:hypothetical protein